MHSCFVSDTDVLIYGNLNNLQKKYFKNHRCTLTHNVSAGISFMNDRTVMDDYESLVLSAYLKENQVMYDKTLPIIKYYRKTTNQAEFVI